VSEIERRAVQKVIDRARELGMGDQIPQSILELASVHDHNGGAVRWARANPDEKTWPGGCCVGNDVYGPERCTCWVPVFDLEQSTELQEIASPLDCDERDKLCGDCAFRPDSPERSDNDGFTEDTLFDMTRSGGRQMFFCHQGVRRAIRYEHPDGRVIEAGPGDYQPVYTGPVPHRADGRAGEVCAGYALHVRKFEEEVQPDWLVKLAAMFADGEVLPGGMFWEHPPPVGKGGNGILGRGLVPQAIADFRRGRRGRPVRASAGARRVEAPVTPLPIRRQIVGVLRANPGRWARVYDGGPIGSGTMCEWYRKSMPGNKIGTAMRTQGLTCAVYACFRPELAWVL
jgi:hypothetical protein